jgi:hypothetical protein
MAISKDELSQMNFGYLNGSDLMQFAPFELLSSQYSKFPGYFQTGCNQAYAEMMSELSTRYDIQKELSNSNNKQINQTGTIQVVISAGSYISRITIICDVDSSVQIGTTPTGNEILDKLQLYGTNSISFWVNKIFPVDTILYFQIEGIITFDVVCNSGITSPPITIKELLNQDVSFSFDIPANTYLYQVFANILLSTPSVQIGTTVGGSEIVPITVVSGAILPIITNKNYFANATTLYFTITDGSIDFRLDIGYNFIAPTPIPNPLREMMFAQITSIIALKNILGSISGDNTLLKSHFAWAYDNIQKIKSRQMNLQLNSPPTSMESRAYMVQDSFQMLG